jgi:hypothetical protein
LPVKKPAHIGPSNHARATWQRGRREDVNSKVERQTVDLSAYPDLVVTYRGMRVNAWTGMRTLLGLGPQIKNSVGEKPDGLLLHEDFIMSMIPLHLGMRQ